MTRRKSCFAAVLMSMPNRGEDAEVNRVGDDEVARLSVDAIRLIAESACQLKKTTIKELIEYGRAGGKELDRFLDWESKAVPGTKPALASNDGPPGVAKPFLTDLGPSA